MNSIYLSRIAISNFRTYGEDFSIDLPEEPGLTVICGMNGLGKTAFFDAIEWALLGEIQRLSNDRMRKPEGNPLTREGADPGSHRVELSWGNNQKVIRTKQEAQTPAQLTAFLKDPGWGPQIHDLSVYLRLTHFLPQATRERFLERDGKAQWSLLQGPAGVERLERLRKMLDDGKARNAFDRYIANLERLQAEALERVEDWKKLEEEQDRWTKLAAAGAAISPEELQSILGELESAIPLNDQKTAVKEPIQRLAAIRMAVEKISALLRNLNHDLSGFETMARRYAELAQRIRAMQETFANAQKDSEEIRRVQEEGKGKLASMRVEITNLDAKKVTANQFSISAMIALESESRRLAASKQQAALKARISESTKQLADLEQRRTAHLKQIEEYNVAVKGMKTARQNLSILAKTEQEYATFIKALREYEAQGKEETALADRKKSLLAKKTTLDQAIAGLDAKIKGVSERLANEQRSVDEAVQALGRVIRHLRSEDTVCPVCAQVYPPGELLQKAQDSLERYNGRTAALIEELRKLQHEAEEARERQTQFSRETAEVEASLAARTSIGTEIEKQKNGLLQRPEIAGASLQNLPSILKERGTALNEQEQHYRAKVNALRVSDELASAVQQFEITEKNLRDQLQVAKTELDQTDGVLQECQARLATTSEIVKVGGGLDKLPEYRNERLREIANLDRDIKDLQGQLEQHERRFQADTSKNAERVAKREADEKLIAELKEESNRLVASWKALGYEGELNESAVQQARLAVEKKMSENQKLVDRITNAVGGAEAWARQTQLTALNLSVADVIKNAGANSKEQCASILQQQYAGRSSELKRAQAAQGRAEEVAHKLMDLTGRFSESALEPLSSRISAFNRLISPFPYEFKLNPHVTATRTRTEARVTMPSVRSNRPLERDPEWWLSEGQMSAMGLSVLLGASTIYRWSRWRALLLDDPLQNTDLIHAAAFGDVIRSLMRDEGYQIIVSTHNLDEADFLIRKCRRANLPVRKVELLSLGPAGLRYSFRDC